jgi:hypothetical protein
MFIGDDAIPLLWHSVWQFKTMPTAILRFLAGETFVVVADGLSRDRETGEMHNNEKKLFLINNAESSLVYALTGTGRIKDPSDTFVAVDLVTELSKAVTPVAKQKPDSLLAFAKRVAEKLQRALKTAKDAGRIIGYSANPDPAQPDQCLIAHIFFWGYYNGSAARADVKIAHRNQSLSPIESTGTAVDAFPEVRGSTVSTVLFSESPDPRLSAYWIPAMAKFFTPNFSRDTFTIDEAKDIAINYIRACESDAGRAIDPTYAPGIGGHIQIATVTPENNGAKWMPGYEPA